MEELHYLLNYKNLKIIQNSKLFKFSLDSVLLANFVKLNYRTKKILDIGTGNAPIPLILSTKTKAIITAIEIQRESYELAEKSVYINHLEGQILVKNEDIREYYKKTESDIYDVIVCNPPFFKYSASSIINQSISKTQARHELSLTVSDIFKVARKLLKNNGSIAIVHRPERMIDIIEEMRKNNIEPKRLQFIYPNIGKEVNMLLIEGTKNGKVGLKVLEPVYVYDQEGNYTTEIIKYFKE